MKTILSKKEIVASIAIGILAAIWILIKYGAPL
jgi:hypothetical protein